MRELHALSQELKVAQAVLDVGPSVRVQLAWAVDLELAGAVVEGLARRLVAGGGGTGQGGGAADGGGGIERGARRAAAAE